MDVKISESAATKDVVRPVAMLQTLHDLGVRVSIDGFGTRCLSLQQEAAFQIRHRTDAH